LALPAAPAASSHFANFYQLSILLIIGTIVVTRQVKYIQTMNLGYDREALLSIPLEGDLVKQYPLFKQEALQLPGVQQVTYMSTVPAELENGTGAVEWAGKAAGFKGVFAYSAVEYGFTQTMKAQLLAGRDFSPSFPTDTTGYIVNAEAAALMGMRDPVGRELQMWDRKGKIVGVIKDLHFGSVHDPIKPLIILFVNGLDNGHILVRTDPGQTARALGGLKQLCRRLNPACPGFPAAGAACLCDCCAGCGVGDAAVAGGLCLLCAVDGLDIYGGGVAGFFDRLPYGWVSCDPDCLG
jgi:putative ABC transport system permease protein